MVIKAQVSYTVIHWHRQGFRLFWRRKSRPGKAGRKSITQDTIALIQNMSRANPLWGAPRIHGELLKLAITVAQRTVSKYMVRTTLWFADPEVHAAFCKILLDGKGVVSIDRHALTVSYPRQAEPMVQAGLKKLNEAYTVAMEDLEN